MKIFWEGLWWEGLYLPEHSYFGYNKTANCGYCLEEIDICVTCTHVQFTNCSLIVQCTNYSMFQFQPYCSMLVTSKGCTDFLEFKILLEKRDGFYWNIEKSYLDLVLCWIPGILHKDEIYYRLECSVVCIISIGLGADSKLGNLTFTWSKNWKVQLAVGYFFPLWVMLTAAITLRLKSLFTI